MAFAYLKPQRDQVFLLPVSMADWLEEGHLAFFVIDVVGELDTRALHARHPNDGAGRPAYDPDMMVALLLYAYSNGLRSSRRIEASCRTDAAYRVICGGLVPDHTTISRFVVDQQEAIEGLFVSGLRLCAAAGLVDLSVVALDGTKMGTDAALDVNRDAAWIRRQVEALLAATVASEAAEAEVAQVPLAGFEAMGELASARGRLARLQAALAVIEAEEAAAATEVAAKTEAAQQAAQAGRKLTGRKPKDPAAALARAQADHAATLVKAQAKAARRAAKVAAAEAAGASIRGLAPGPDRNLEKAEATLAAARAAAEAAPAAKHQANVTDPDSRIMKTLAGWVQGYNAQVVVASNQIVLAQSVSQDAFDVGLFQPMVSLLAETANAAGITDPATLVLADAGYWSEANATVNGPDRLIATLKDHKQRRAAREAGTTTGDPPEGASPLEAMEHRLRTPEGAAAYALRSSIVEPVFGDHKENKGWRRFRRRGLGAAGSEWSFMNLTHNMGKLADHRRTHSVTLALN
jgi:transposase